MITRNKKLFKVHKISIDQLLMNLKKSKDSMTTISIKELIVRSHLNMKIAIISLSKSISMSTKRLIE